MKLKISLMFSLVFGLFLIGFVMATSVGTSDSDFTEDRVVYTPSVVSFNNATAYVNDTVFFQSLIPSDFWLAATAQVGLTGDKTGSFALSTSSTGRFDAGLLDNSNIASVNLVNRQLLDSSGVIAVGWEAYKLYDNTGGADSLDWNNRVDIASDGVDQVFNWYTSGTADFLDSERIGTGNIKLQSDANKYYLGASDDTSFFFNGSDPIMNAEVGSQTFYFQNFDAIRVGDTIVSTTSGLFATRLNSDSWWDEAGTTELITLTGGLLDFSQAIGMSNEDISGVGTLTASVLTDGTATLYGGDLTGLLSLVVDDLTLDGNSIVSDTGEVLIDSNVSVSGNVTMGDLHIKQQSDWVLGSTVDGGLKISGYDDESIYNFTFGVNENGFGMVDLSALVSEQMYFTASGGHIATLNAGGLNYYSGKIMRFGSSASYETFMHSADQTNEAFMFGVTDSGSVSRTAITSDKNDRNFNFQHPVSPYPIWYWQSANQVLDEWGSIGFNGSVFFFNATKDGIWLDNDTTIRGELEVIGNITSENVFYPQGIFAHNSATIPLVAVNVWTNVTFDEEVTAIMYGIDHTWDDNTNHTFTINEDGVYELDYDFDVEDASGTPSDIDVAGRVIYINGTEVVGSVFEIDIVKQGNEAELSHDFFAKIGAGSQIKFQFVGSDADIQISTHGTFGDHPESATIVIKKVANL